MAVATVVLGSAIFGVVALAGRAGGELTRPRVGTPRKTAVVARVMRAAGQVRARIGASAGGWNPLGAGSVLAGGTQLRTGAGASCMVRMATSQEVQLGESTLVELRPRSLNTGDASIAMGVPAWRVTPITRPGNSGDPDTLLARALSKQAFEHISAEQRLSLGGAAKKRAGELLARAREAARQGEAALIGGQDRPAFLGFALAWRLMNAYAALLRRELGAGQALLVTRTTSGESAVASYGGKVRVTDRSTGRSALLDRGQGLVGGNSVDLLPAPGGVQVAGDTVSPADPAAPRHRAHFTNVLRRDRAPLRIRVGFSPVDGATGYVVSLVERGGGQQLSRRLPPGAREAVFSFFDPETGGQPKRAATSGDPESERAALIPRDGNPAVYEVRVQGLRDGLPGLYDPRYLEVVDVSRRAAGARAKPLRWD